MKTKKTALVTLLFVSLFAQTLVGQAQQDARVQELEDRVRHLEQLVQTLVENQRGRGAISPESADSMMAELAGGAGNSLLPASQGPAASSEPKVEPARRLPQELLPQLGKIGAQVSFTAGLNSGPFALNRGSYYAGAIDLPLALVPGGRLSYEISAGLAQTSRTGTITSNVAQVANLAVLTTLNPNGGLANVQDALSGTGSAPFPVTASANFKAQVLQLVPFSLRYDFTRLDRCRLRPYALMGMGTYVTISTQNTTAGLRQNSTLGSTTINLISGLLGPSPFSGALIGGQIAAASQLPARNIPSGQGGFDLGLQAGGGLEYRFSNSLSAAFDARYNMVPDGMSYHTLAARWGWHF